MRLNMTSGKRAGEMVDRAGAAWGYAGSFTDILIAAGRHWRVVNQKEYDRRNWKNFLNPFSAVEN